MTTTNIPNPNRFHIGVYDDGNLLDLFLLCPDETCGPHETIQGPVTLDEIHEVIDRHIHTHHQPPAEVSNR